MSEINIAKIILDSLLQALPALWPLFTLLFFIMTVKFFIILYRNQQLSKAGMFEIDKMSGDDFEKYLAVLFEKLGYSAEIVGSHKGDYGTDLVLEKNGERVAVQAKCWHNTVGIRSVQEVYGSLQFYNCSRAIVVTNNYFSHEAKQLARTNKVELWNRDVLKNIILSLRK